MDIVRPLLDEKAEHFCNVYRGIDSRTACVLDFHGQPIVLVPSTRLHDEAHYRYFRGFFYINHPEKAIVELTKAIDQYGDHVEARILRANLLLQQQRYDAAIKDLTEAIQHFTLNKEYPDAYAMRGSAYYSKERFKEAMDDFTEYLKRHPDSYASRIQRSFCFYQLGDWNSAITDLNAVLATEPHEFRARSALANIYTEKGEPTKALTLLDDETCEAASSRPNELRLLFVARGLAQAAMHRREAAIASFSRAIELDPEDDFALRCRAIQYSQGPDGPKMAEQDLQRADQIADRREAVISFDVPLEGEPEEPAAPVVVEDTNSAGTLVQPEEPLTGSEGLYNKMCSVMFYLNDTVAALNDFSFWASFDVKKAGLCLGFALAFAFLELLPSNGGQWRPPSVYLTCFVLWLGLTSSCMISDSA
jgi:tetratricopeptide (TPR) repeat protein